MRHSKVSKPKSVFTNWDIGAFILVLLIAIAAPFQVLKETAQTKTLVLKVLNK